MENLDKRERLAEWSSSIVLYHIVYCFSIPSLIEYVSTIVTLEPGDLILTGTPEGVGPVKAGQKVEAGITGFITISFPVVDRPTPNL